LRRRLKCRRLRRRKRAKIVEDWVVSSFAPTSFSSQRAEIYLWVERELLPISS